MEIGISCSHPEDIEAAQNILTQFGEATGCVVVADGQGVGVVGIVTADCVTSRSINEGVAIANAQAKDGRTFRVFTPN